MGFPHHAGRYQRGGFRFRPPVVRIVDAWEDFRTGYVALSSPDGADSKRASQSAIGQWDWVSHIARGGVQNSIFVPRVSEL